MRALFFFLCYRQVAGHGLIVSCRVQMRTEQQNKVVSSIGDRVVETRKNHVVTITYTTKEEGPGKIINWFYGWRAEVGSFATEELLYFCFQGALSALKNACLIQELSVF